MTGHFAMLLNGWSSPTTVTTAIGSFVADGAGNISGGNVDLNDQVNGPLAGAFTGTYCVSSNNLATIKINYSGGISGTNTFAAALNSTGNGNIIFYDATILKASGLLRKQDISAFSTSKINGNYAFGFIGATETTSRFAIAGEFSATGSAHLVGEFDSDIFLTGAKNSTLTSADLSVAATGRATATITFNGLNNSKFVFYVVSATEMLAMQDDLAGSPLVAGRVLKQSGSFTDASLNGVSVVELQSLSAGTTPSMTAGLVTTNGTGTIGWLADQNLAGTTTTLGRYGTFIARSNGRVTQLLGGDPAPQVFYMIQPNQAFVVGTDPLTVDSGVLEPQVGTSFTKASLKGTYLGGSMQPVNASVDEHVGAVPDRSGASALARRPATMAMKSKLRPARSVRLMPVSSNGRAVVSTSASQVGIVYIISPSQFVFLPASSSDTKPALSQFQQ